jgi:hypothetical protein
MSDLARPYPPGQTPGAIAGSPAASAAHLDEPERPGSERATPANASLARDYKDDRTK